MGTPHALTGGGAGSSWVARRSLGCRWAPEHISGSLQLVGGQLEFRV